LNARAIAIALGIALAISVAVNLFAATAAYTALTGENRVERRHDGGEAGQRGLGMRDMLAELDPGTRSAVREAMRDAALRARPDFQQARQARRDAVAAAAAEPYDPAVVTALLEQSRVAEARGRLSLETDTLAILATLRPEDRAAVARILNTRSRGGGRGRSSEAEPASETR
jgi:uncharacterized membrane protein